MEYIILCLMALLVLYVFAGPVFNIKPKKRDFGSVGLDNSPESDCFSDVGDGDGE